MIVYNYINDNDFNNDKNSQPIVTVALLTSMLARNILRSSVSSLRSLQVASNVASKLVRMSHNRYTSTSV